MSVKKKGTHFDIHSSIYVAVRKRCHILWVLGQFVATYFTDKQQKLKKICGSLYPCHQGHWHDKWKDYYTRPVHWILCLPLSRGTNGSIDIVMYRLGQYWTKTNNELQLFIVCVSIDSHKSICHRSQYVCNIFQGKENRFVSQCATESMHEELGSASRHILPTCEYVQNFFSSSDCPSKQANTTTRRSSLK